LKGDFGWEVQALPRLLTLSLTETTRGENDYQVIARDLDNDRWVMVSVPREEFRSGQDVKWDLFAVTEADVEEKPRRSRPEEYVLTQASTPRLTGRYSTPDQRIEILADLAVGSITNDIKKSPGYVGIVVVDTVQDISMSIKGHELDQNDFDPERRFFWESRIKFINDGLWWNRPCKDMRWKQYWLDVKERREHDFEALKKKWISYISNHHTYFLIEFYAATPRFPGKKYPVISGVHCF
jgi:hypothetical protein